MYGLKGGFIGSGNPNVSIKLVGKSLSRKPRKRVLKGSLQLTVKVLPRAQIHEKKNEPCKYFANIYMQVELGVSSPNPDLSPVHGMRFKF